MKLPRLPFRWKLTLLLTVPPLLLVCLSFSTVFYQIESARKDEEQKNNILLGEQFKKTIKKISDETILFSQNLFLSYEPTKGTLGASGLSLFRSHKNILKFEIYNIKSGHIVFQIQKKHFASHHFSQEKQLHSSPISLSHIENFTFLLDQAVPNDINLLRTRIIFSTENDFAPFLSQGHLSIWQNQKILLNSGKSTSKSNSSHKDKILAYGKFPHSNISYMYAKQNIATLALFSEGSIRSAMIPFVGFLSLILCFLPFIGSISYRMRELKGRVKKRMDIVTRKRVMKEVDQAVYNELQKLHPAFDFNFKNHKWEISYLSQTNYFSRGQFALSFQKGSSLLIGTLTSDMNAIETSQFYAASLMLFEQFKSDQFSRHEILLNWENGLSLLSNDQNRIALSVFEFDCETFEVKYLSQNRFFGVQIEEQDQGYEGYDLELQSQGTLQLNPNSSCVLYFGARGSEYHLNESHRKLIASALSVRAEFSESTNGLLRKSIHEFQSRLSQPNQLLGCLVFHIHGPTKFATLESESYDIKYKQQDAQV